MKRLAVINDLQMALLALPEMTVGQNSFTYTDRSSGERKVRITHEWVERSTSKPPEAPEAVYPPDGGQAVWPPHSSRGRTARVAPALPPMADSARGQPVRPPHPP